MKISEVITKLHEFHAPLDHPEHTCDTVKFGDPDRECTGIAVTCCATVDAIRESAAKGCNLLIAHEPLFYNDRDHTDFLQGDAVYEEKCRLLKVTGVVVWRDHDHMHGPGGPGAAVHEEIDYIFHGIMKELGWEEYVTGETTKPLTYVIPPVTVTELTKTLMEKFDLTGARIVGDPDAVVSKVFFCEHINGSPMSGDEKKIVKAADYDVMIPLEIVDWTLSAYVRDAAQLGRGKAIIEMGHFNTEELGMRYMTRWLPEVLGGNIPVRYIKSGDSFRYLTR